MKSVTDVLMCVFRDYRSVVSGHTVCGVSELFSMWVNEGWHFLSLPVFLGSSRGVICLISPQRVEKSLFYPCLATALMSFQIRFNDTERKAQFTPVTCVQKSGLGIFKQRFAGPRTASAIPLRQVKCVTAKRKFIINTNTRLKVCRGVAFSRKDLFLANCPH